MQMEITKMLRLLGEDPTYAKVLQHIDKYDKMQIISMVSQITKFIGSYQNPSDAQKNSHHVIWCNGNPTSNSK